MCCALKKSLTFPVIPAAPYICKYMDSARWDNEKINWKLILCTFVWHLFQHSTCLCWQAHMRPHAWFCMQNNNKMLPRSALALLDLRGRNTGRELEAGRLLTQTGDVTTVTLDGVSHPWQGAWDSRKFYWTLRISYTECLPLLLSYLLQSCYSHSAAAMRDSRSEAAKANLRLI